MVILFLLLWKVTALLCYFTNYQSSNTGDGSEYFVINTVDGCKGTIFTSNIITDRERYPTINLTILASDRSSSPNTVSVSVTYRHSIMY